MTDMDKMTLRAQLQAANSALMSAKAVASAPIITPTGPIIIQGPLMICTALDQFSRVLDLIIDKS